MPNFVDGESALRPYVDDLVTRYHQDLAEHAVTIGCLFAMSPRDEEGHPTGPALKHGGYPALGLMRIVSQRDRVAGLPDAQLIIDGERWPELAEPEREALVDHELYHLIVRTEGGIRGGVVKTDDCGRPKLKMRLHDVQLGGFTAIIERHKEHATEAKVFEVASREWRQLLLWPEELKPLKMAQ